MLLVRILSGLIVSFVTVSVLASLYQPFLPVLDAGLVVVTGCTPGGLGFEVVKDILQQRPSSVKILCTVRKEKDAEAIRTAFGTARIQSVLLDVTDVSALKKLSEELKHEKVIALINNEGISKHSKLGVSFKKLTNEFTK